MAIVWKARYGYGPEITGTSPILNLSEISFTDDGPFSILTSPPNVPSGFKYASRTGAVTASATPSQKFEDSNGLGVGLESLLGDDSRFIYTRPRSGSIMTSDDIDYTNIKLAAPSALLACPNLFDVWVSSGIRIYSYIYIPGLQKVIDYVGRVYDVLSGGRLNLLSSSYNYYGPNSACTFEPNSKKTYNTYILYAPTYDGTKESIINGDQYYLQFYATGSSTSRYVVNMSDNNTQSVDFYAALFKDFISPDYETPTNPYEPGGESGPGGGGGTFDWDSDKIELAPIPTLSSANTGFTRIYNPTLSQVQALANYLWTDESVIETIWNHIKQFFENPMEAIIGFNLVPVPVPDGGTENFKLMYIDTGVSMTVAASQFVDVDCGSLEIPLHYGSALDYSPYTKISCYLPYIGTVSLNTDEVMGRTLSILYRVDICSGSCVANIAIDGDYLYQYSGHCAVPIPLASADFSTYVSAAISVGKLAGAALLAGSGIIAPPDIPTATQHTNQTTTTTTTDTARNPATNRQITTGTHTVVQSTESSSERSGTQASYNGLTPQSVSNTVGEVVSSKPHVEHSGSFSGNSGYIAGVRRPFIILEAPRMCMPGNYQQFNGFPCMMKLNLGDCKGFTRVQQVHLTGLWATNPEQAEILELLKMGVIL